MTLPPDTRSITARLLLALGLMGVGAGGTWLLMRQTTTAPGASSGDTRQAGGASPTTAGPAGNAAPARAASVTLSAEAMQRAGLEIVAVETRAVDSTLRLPAIVRPDAYREVIVSPLVGGRVASVNGVLGEAVSVGHPLATLVSTELAEAQNRYLTHRAQLEADHARLMRTEKLVQIGAASRQELDDVKAVHEAHETELQSSRSMLRVLGMANDEVSRLETAEDVRASVVVRSPADGIITKRETNAGQTVSTETGMFVVSRLDRVWVVASAFEPDLARIRVGLPATITSEAVPGLEIRGTVAYVDPTIDPATRTTSVRVEVANPKRVLAFGMYAHVTLQGTPRDALVAPASAIQTVGTRTMVYVERPETPGRFEERVVQTGMARDAWVEIREGLRTGERVVGRGSFFLRAELERTGSAGTGMGAGTAPTPDAHAARARTDGGSTAATSTGPLAVTLTVDGRGFSPSTITARPGQILHLTFVRKADTTCGTELSIPALGITRPLPLDAPVHVQITAPDSGELTFSCGMDMLKGRVVVGGH